MYFGFLVFVLGLRFDLFYISSLLFHLEPHCHFFSDSVLPSYY